MGGTVEALRAAYSTANTWDELATGVVAAGVVIELLALLLFGKGMPRKEKIALAVGSILVVIGVAGEWVYGARAANAASELQSRAELDIASAKDQAATATADAALLGVSVNELHSFVTTQEDSNSAAIGELKRSTAGLNKARDDARAAADATKGDLAKITALLSQEQNLHQQVLALTTPRQIDDANFKALVDALKPFAKTPIDFGTTVDDEKMSLLVRISDAVAAAGWSIQACSNSGSVYTNERPGLPNICEKTVRGVVILISMSDLQKLGPIAEALVDALKTAGIPTQAGIFPDKMPDGTPMPHTAPPGTIHLVVGAKT